MTSHLLLFLFYESLICIPMHNLQSVFNYKCELTSSMKKQGKAKSSLE